MTVLSERLTQLEDLLRQLQAPIIGISVRRRQRHRSRSSSARRLRRGSTR